MTFGQDTSLGIFQTQAVKLYHDHPHVQKQVYHLALEALQSDTCFTVVI